MGLRRVPRASSFFCLKMRQEAPIRIMYVKTTGNSTDIFGDHNVSRESSQSRGFILMLDLATPFLLSLRRQVQNPYLKVKARFLGRSIHQSLFSLKSYKPL